MKIIIPKNTTLIRLVLTNRSRFYNQDWYFDQEFAHTNVGGEWEVDSGFKGKYPAAVLAYMYVHAHRNHPLNYQFCWTSDADYQGDKVYVGRAEAGGFQIHRHLKIRPEQFVNSLD